MRFGEAMGGLKCLLTRRPLIHSLDIPLKNIRFNWARPSQVLTKLQTNQGAVMNSKTEVYELEMDGLNYDYGFRAMRDMLGRMRQEDHELRSQITDAEKKASRTRGVNNEFAVDGLIELYEYSGYQDAAHSMAAIGMIAPFVESSFREAFEEFGRVLPKKNKVVYILKTISEMGWDKHMPENLEVTLTALFEYRNKLLHHGFEWPPEIRKRFAQRLKTSGWPSGWFSKAPTRGDAWMFYMTYTFIDHCIDTIEKVAVGLEKLKRERLSQQL